MSVELESLVKKLNPFCRQALQKAAEKCVNQTNYNVELEHFILQLLERHDSDFYIILTNYHIEIDKAKSLCSKAVDHLKRGNSRTPAMSPHILALLEEAWMHSSMNLSDSVIRSGAILWALLTNSTLRGVTLESIPILLNLPLKDLSVNIKSLLTRSPESPGYIPENREQHHPSLAGEPIPPVTETPALDQFTIDITRRVRNQLVDPVVGRDREIRQIIDILTRRRQNNPILTGDAGVGKTAIAEGFAIRVVDGQVPPSLKEVMVRTLDLGQLQAGAGIKGEFEQRLKDVMAEVKSSPKPIILFIDEAHTLIGAGGQAGQGDAANLLKPALARGELRTIAATTWGEYKKYFEKDPALVRRFQVVQVDEPEPDKAIEMLRATAKTLEAHHGVQILDEAIVSAVKLSHRYISGKRLPDKAVSLLDTACARVAIGHVSEPELIEDLRRQILMTQNKIEILGRESFLEENHQAETESLTAHLDVIESRLEEMSQRWENERETISQILKLQSEFVVAEDPSSIDSEILDQLSQLRKLLSEIQDSSPMAQPNVDEEIIASIISNWTGIPVGKMMTNEIQSILELEKTMRKRLIGQNHALEAISRRVRTSRARLEDPGKPVGVFLLVGPSGVGKTETALTLADILYGGEENVITVNMSEYQEAHTVSSLKGAPPGYVGFGTGGVLTEAVRRKPFSVILLDEVEKAHPDVMELFYQVFDKGTIEDGEGVKVNFKNTIILLTSNVASDIISNQCQHSDSLPDTKTLVEAIRPSLLNVFKPALLGRLVIVPYYQLGDDQIRTIVSLKLDKIRNRFQEYHQAELSFDSNLIDVITDRCTEVDSGARNIDSILTHTILPGLSDQILSRMADQEEFNTVNVYLNESGQFDYAFDHVPSPIKTDTIYN